MDQSGLPLPGALVRLTPAPAGQGPSAAGSAAGAGGQAGAVPGQAGSAAVQTTYTAADGTFGFDIAPGRFRLDAELDGFQTVTREVDLLEPTVLPDIVLAIKAFSAETTVVAVVPTEIQPRQFSAPATVAPEVIENAPAQTNSYVDMLPLVPNVVRGPDGLVSLAGARAPLGIVLVNNVPASDAASGEPLAAVPLGAVENVQVITTGFPAESGPTTGGVTVINSRTGSDKLYFQVNSFMPRPRLADRGIHGLEAWQPNGAIRGPIVRGRAWYALALDFHWEKMRQQTLEGNQDRRQRDLTSFSQFDVKASDRQTLSGWVNARLEHVEGERLGAFTPLGTVPNVERTAVGMTVVDRLVQGLSTLETRVGARRNAASLEPAAAGPYLVGHDLTRGGYFGTADRRAWSYGAAAVYSRVIGSHVLKSGVSFDRRQLDGFEQNAPVTYLWSSLAPAREIEFVGPGDYHVASNVLGAFLQDGWDLASAVRLDMGVRLDHDSGAETWLSPRAGVTWSAAPWATVSGGIGLFASDVPLTALAFPFYQSRRVSFYDQAGAPVGEPVTYWNRSADLSLAHARIWSARVDWRLSREWQLRTAFQERRGTDELSVDPTLVGGEPAALLSATGKSRTRSFEATVGFRPSGRPHQLYLSYVRAASDGNTNDFSQIEGLFKSPRLDPAEYAPLPSAVPHRLLAWGVFALPARITVAPFLDIRSGFPYSAVNDDWSYAGPQFSRRYPMFASLDVVVNKIVTLRKNTRARVGIKLYNIAGRQNGREVQADIARPDFGHTFNPLGRQLRGVFEIIWNGSARK